MRRHLTDRQEVLPALAEVFREHGFEGASLARIAQATGLGKGSLYHYFPGGKTEMAAAVLAKIDAWFEGHVFTSLRRCAASRIPTVRSERCLNPLGGTSRGGRRVCLVGLFALGDVRRTFARPVRAYFRRWVDALATAPVRGGLAPAGAADLAEDAVTTIQGAIILTRARGPERVPACRLARARTAAPDALPGSSAGHGPAGPAPPPSAAVR